MTSTHKELFEVIEKDLKEYIHYRTDKGILLNGDVLDILPKIPNNSFDLLLTDPPYKVTSKGTSKKSTTGGMLNSKLCKEGKIFKHNDIKISEWLPLISPKIKDDRFMYIMTNHKNLLEFLVEIDKQNLNFIKSLIWDKQNKIVSRYYMNQFEYILFLRKGKALDITLKGINNKGTSDILSVKNSKTKINGENIHDTEKPIELNKILIENSTNPDMVVLEPFSGSGSTLLSAEMLGRYWIGIEKDEKYCDVIAKRFQDFKENELNYEINEWE